MFSPLLLVVLQDSFLIYSGKHEGGMFLKTMH